MHSKMYFFAYLMIVISSVSLAISNTEQPNIIVIVADDLGYNDVSWHNSDIVSPNLERLAR